MANLNKSKSLAGVINQEPDEALSLAGAISDQPAKLVPTETKQPVVPTPEQAADRTKVQAAKINTIKSIIPPQMDPDSGKITQPQSMVEIVNKAFGNYDKALGEIDKSYQVKYDKLAADIDKALAEKKDIREMGEWMQMANMLIDNVVQAGASMYGLKHGIDMSGIRVAQPDIKSIIDSRLASVDDRVQAVKEKQGMLGLERKEKGTRLGEQAKAGLEAELKDVTKGEEREFRAEESQKERDAKLERAQAEAANRAALAGAKQEDKVAKGVTDAEDKLRREWNTDPVTKDTKTMASALQKIKRVANDSSAAGDLSLIFNYMKLLDPASTVREGEQALAANAAGVPDKIRNMYNKIMAGEKLAPEQRKDFLTQSDRLYGSQLEVQKTVDDKIRKVAGKRGVDTEVVLNEDLYNIGGRKQPAAQSTPAALVATKPLAEGEIRRKTKDGRFVIFDKDKNFLRYEQ